MRLPVCLPVPLSVRLCPPGCTSARANLSVRLPDHPIRPPFDSLSFCLSPLSLSLSVYVSISLFLFLSLSFSVSLSPLTLLSLPLSASLLVLSPTSTSVFQSLCSSVSLLSVSSSLSVCLVWLCICSSVYLFACLFICVAVCTVRLGTILTILTIFLYLWIRQVDFFHRIPTPSMWIYYLLYLLCSG